MLIVMFYINLSSRRQNFRFLNVTVYACYVTTVFFTLEQIWQLENNHELQYIGL